MGDSSGGWTSAMAAVTGDAPEMEGTVGTTGVSSSRVQAAVAFYPPTNFVTMDAWALREVRRAADLPRRRERPRNRVCVGCAIQTLPRQGAGRQPAALHQSARTRQS